MKFYIIGVNKSFSIKTESSKLEVNKKVINHSLIKNKIIKIIVVNIKVDLKIIEIDCELFLFWTLENSEYSIVLIDSGIIDIRSHKVSDNV